MFTIVIFVDNSCIFSILMPTLHIIWCIKSQKSIFATEHSWILIMTNNFQSQKARHPTEVYKLINSIRDLRKRNILRGYVAKSSITHQEAEIIRKENSLHDCMIVGALLKGPHGLLKESSKKTSSDLLIMTPFPPMNWRYEVCYTAGYINSACYDAVKMLSYIKKLARLETLDSDYALGLLLDLSEQYGASNYLSYKLAYLRSARNIPNTLQPILSKIEDEIGHRNNPVMHFSAIENLSSKLSLFAIAQSRISRYVSIVNGDFRKALPLSNFIPTPLDIEDVAGFLLRATESCLLDTIYSVLVIFNLSSELSAVRIELERYLKPEFMTQLLDVIQFAAQSDDGSIVTCLYQAHNQESYLSLELYRISSAFLERPKFAIYRNKFDRVIGFRLLAEIIDGKVTSVSKPFDNKELLLSRDSLFLNENFPVPLDALFLNEILPVSLDTFYRTTLFLMFIGNKNNISNFTKTEIKFIFENTLSLDLLLTEEEMNTLYLTTPQETKSLVTVLALALFRTKSIDPDVDFRFRTDFISHVNNDHNGSIIDFIDYLLEDSPQVANYIVRTLDEVTLEKMYTLVKNSSQVIEIRSKILKSAGNKLNRIEYLIEADQITTRTKLSTLQQYFDSSRMYVDSIAMKKWLDNNQTISTDQYRSLYASVEARILSLDNDSSCNNDMSSDQLNEKEDYLFSQIAKDAFEQFCLNAEFGIESYLCRRIRHNTIDNVTTDIVDTVLRKREYEVVMTNASTRRTVDTWMASYKSIIDRLRKDYLQFKPYNSFFNATLDLEDSTTKDNIRNISNNLKSSGGTELLNDLLITFCWEQITPQLENAARTIRTKLLNEANTSIDKFFSANISALEVQMKSELHEAVNEIFKKVADWFQTPRRGFISASVSDLCQIILLELNRNNGVEYTGNALHIKYTGISVHRLYDCLDVLLKNAQIHGKDDTTIFVNVYTNRTSTATILDKLSVEITSTVAMQKYSQSKDRILKAIESVETGKDMVTEGYTGIKKIKIITRTSEGCPTIQCEPNDDTKELKISFTIHAERANEDSAIAGKKS